MISMRIDHIALYCTDLEGMKAFFCNYFKAEPNDLYHNPRTGLSTYILSFPEGGTRLELMTRAEVMQEDGVSPYRHGFIHVSFNLGSKEAVDELTAKLQADGFQVCSGPRVTGDGYYESAVLGPENILIELTK